MTVSSTTPQLSTNSMVLSQAQPAEQEQKMTPLSESRNLQLVPVAQKTSLVAQGIMAPTTLNIQTALLKLAKAGVKNQQLAHYLFALHKNNEVYDPKKNELDDALFKVYQVAAVIGRERNEEHPEMTSDQHSRLVLKLNESMESFYNLLKKHPEASPNQIGKIFTVLSQLACAEPYVGKSQGNGILTRNLLPRLIEAKKLENPKEADQFPRSLRFETADEQAAASRVKPIKSAGNRVSRCSLSRLVWSGAILGTVFISGARLQNESLCPSLPSLFNPELDSSASLAPVLPPVPAVVVPVNVDPIRSFVETTGEYGPERNPLAFDESDYNSGSALTSENSSEEAPWYEKEAPSILQNLGVYGAGLLASAVPTIRALLQR